MGLDVYLYERTHHEQNARHEREWSELYDRQERGEISEEQRKALDDTITPYAPHVDAASGRYSEHLFNRRYLRSSYNEGGFNHAVPEMIGTTGNGEGKYPSAEGSLYWIFEPMGREWDGDEGALGPEDIVKLKACGLRALGVAERLRGCDRFRVTTISPNMFGPPPGHTDNDALRIFREHLASRPPNQLDDGGWWYSTMGGDLNVFAGGLSIIAAIPGRATFDVPGVHLIYRAADEGFEFYIQAAEITAEFCDEAIELIGRDGSCYLSWSG